MNYQKKFLSMFLLAAFLLTQMTAFAKEETFKYEKEARHLYQMGLFDGISKTEFNPDLGSRLDRTTGIALIVKILGKKEEADALSVEEAENILKKFEDSALLKQDWQKKYMGYVVKTGMVKGISQTKLGALDNILGVQLATIILINFGYEVKDYRESLKVLQEKGGLSVEQVVYFGNKTLLLRDDMVGIGFGALNAVTAKGIKLIHLLAANNLVRTEAAKEAGFVLTRIQVEIPFKISSITPANDAMQVNPESVILVKFLKPVKRTSINTDTVNVKDAVGKTLEGDFSYRNNDDEVLFKPKVALRFGAQYTITVSNVEDNQGNSLEKTVSKFSVRDDIPLMLEIKAMDKSWITKHDTGADVVLGDNDLNTATSVVGDAYGEKTGEFKITFSAAVDAGSLSGLKLKNLSTVQEIDWQPVSVSGKVVYMSIPEGKLDAGMYQISNEAVKLRDGKLVEPKRVSFSVGDAWRVKVSAGPVAGEKDVNGKITDGFNMVFDFGTKVQKETVLVSRIYLEEEISLNIVDASLNVNEAGTGATLTPKKSLSSGVQYHLIISGIKDEKGVACEPIEKGEWSFTVK